MKRFWQEEIPREAYRRIIDAMNARHMTAAKTEQFQVTFIKRKLTRVIDMAAAPECDEQYGWQVSFISKPYCEKGEQKAYAIEIADASSETALNEWIMNERRLKAQL